MKRPWFLMLDEEDQVDGTDLDSFPVSSSPDVLWGKMGKTSFLQLTITTEMTACWVFFQVPASFQRKLSIIRPAAG